MIVVDTSALIAFYNDSEPRHQQMSVTIRAAEVPLVVSPFVVAELDYLLTTRVGTDVAISVLHELGRGAYLIAPIDSDDINAAADVVERYRDQDIGVTDASLVVLAARYGTRTVLTLDRRHFEVLRPLDGGRFRLLPA